MSARARSTVLLALWPVVLTALALPLAVMALVAPAFTRRLASERLLAATARLFLSAAGAELAPGFPLPDGARQVVYTINHSSSLDLLAVAGLGLPRTRTFMKRAMALFLPLGVLAWAGGTFFTVPQTYTARRRRLFAAACDELARTGESVLLSPEGTRVTTGSVGPFNKGAFHLAAALKAPLVPLYIEIPREMDPGRGWRVLARGRVVIHRLDEVDTSGWRVEDAAQNAELVRARYLAFGRALRGETNPGQRRAA